jgi:hypothetical protein
MPDEPIDKIVFDEFALYDHGTSLELHAYDAGTITVTDWDKLKRLAEFIQARFPREKPPNSPTPDKQELTEIIIDAIRAFRETHTAVGATAAALGKRGYVVCEGQHYSDLLDKAHRYDDLIHDIIVDEVERRTGNE